LKIKCWHIRQAPPPRRLFVQARIPKLKGDLAPRSVFSGTEFRTIAKRKTRISLLLPNPKKILPEQKSSHQTEIAPDLLSHTSLLCSLSSATEPQLKFVRWKKEKKYRKYPTTNKKQKNKKERDCIIACFLYTKVKKNQAIEAFDNTRDLGVQSVEKTNNDQKIHTKSPQKQKRKPKHLFLSLSSLPLAQTSGNGAHRGELWEYRNKSQRTPFESCTLITLANMTRDNTTNLHDCVHNKNRNSKERGSAFL
jgi:hypothetical protein